MGASGEPSNELVVLPDRSLVVGTDVGVFASRDGGKRWPVPPVIHRTIGPVAGPPAALRDASFCRS